MLAVRRAGVTEALQSLKRQKLIDSGQIRSSCSIAKALSGWRGLLTAFRKKNIGGSSHLLPSAAGSK